MKQVLSFFCAIIACMVFTSCHSNKVDNQGASDSQIANVQNDEAKAPEKQASSDETSDDEASDNSSFKSHYSDSWWHVADEYKEIVDTMLEKGFYINPRLLPENFDGNLKLSIRDDGVEYESSLSNDILAYFGGYWYLNGEPIEKSVYLMMLPNEGIRLNSNISTLFDEAISFRPDFSRPNISSPKTSNEVKCRIQLFSSDLHINPKGFSLDVVSNLNGFDLHSEECDRLFIITGANSEEDKSAKIIFAYLYEVED